MKEKKVLYYEIGDFYVEAEYGEGITEECVDFWICRKNYGVKMFMFGIPKTEVPEGKIENAFAEYIVLFCDRGYMDSFLEDLLEGDEYVGEDFKINE